MLEMVIPSILLTTFIMRLLMYLKGKKRKVRSTWKQSTEAFLLPNCYLINYPLVENYAQELLLAKRKSDVYPLNSDYVKTF